MVSDQSNHICLKEIDFFFSFFFSKFKELLFLLDLSSCILITALVCSH